jgi:hypothetical protein
MSLASRVAPIRPLVDYPQVLGLGTLKADKFAIAGIVVLYWPHFWGAEGELGNASPAAPTVQEWRQGSEIRQITVIYNL